MERMVFMSNKKDRLIVGTLSVALFSGFTGYSHFIAKEKNIAVPFKASASTVSEAPQSAVGKSGATTSITLTQNTAESKVIPPSDSVPTAPTLKKNTKTRAS